MVSEIGHALYEARDLGAASYLMIKLFLQHYFILGLGLFVRKHLFNELNTHFLLH